MICDQQHQGNGGRCAAYEPPPARAAGFPCLPSGKLRRIQRCCTAVASVVNRQSLQAAAGL